MEEGYELTPVKVRSIVKQSTGLNVANVSLLGEGNDFVSYLINEAWVFRFPKTWEHADTLLSERKTLSALKLSTRVPVIDYWETRPVGFPMPIAGYQLICGESLESLLPSSCATDSLAKELALILSELHQHTIPHRKTRTNAIDLWLADFERDVVQSLPQSLPFDIDAVRVYLSQYQIPDQPLEGDLVSIHGDLGVEHIITERGLRIEGIIDWSNATTGDRFHDFVGLWGWGGDDFVLKVLSHYDLRPSSRDWATIRVMGLMYCIGRYQHFATCNRELYTIALERVCSRVDEVSGGCPYNEP